MQEKSMARRAELAAQEDEPTNDEKMILWELN